MTEVYELDSAYGSQCQRSDFRRTTYPKVGVVAERCGGYAVVGITWEGLTEGTHHSRFCPRHACAFLFPDNASTEGE